MSQRSLKPYAVAFLKIAVTVGALALVFRAIDARDVQTLLHQANPWWLLLALLLNAASQVLGALRFRLYAVRAGAPVARGEALWLSAQGLVLNLVLPGGISGDAYRAAQLMRHHGLRAKPLVQLTLSNRLNGMLWLGVWTALLALFSAHWMQFGSTWLMAGAVAVVLGVAAYAWISARFLAEPVGMQLRASAYSAPLQLCIVAGAFCIGQALGGHAAMVDYVILFMLGCILATLPISIGGVGVREWVLLQGSAWVGIDAAFGVTLALAFFLVYVITALPCALCFLRPNCFLGSK